MFWLCYMMPATRDNGPKPANPALKLDAAKAWRPLALHYPELA